MYGKGGRELQRYRNIMELADPRPIDGIRYLYREMPLLPVSYECDWMISDDGLRHAVIEQMFVIACERESC
jgi:hypothetical protein